MKAASTPLAVTVLSLLLASTLASAETEPAAPDAQALAKQLSNPVANLVSVPFQGNWDFGIGPENDTRFLLNFQPVIPFSLSEKTNLITRIIVPYVGQARLGPSGQAPSGISDIVLSGFFSPAQPKGAIIGIGPVFQLPTTSDPLLGTGKWGIGPTIVVLKQSGKWTYGLLGNQIWSFAGEDDRADLSQMFLQPFISHTSKKAVTVGINTESTANWMADSGELWTVPINLSLTKIAKLGKKPISVGGAVGYYAEKPTGGPEWKIRTLVTLLFPK